MDVKIKQSKYALVNKVMVAFNAGEFAHVENFIDKMVTTTERNIDTNNRNIENAKHTHKSKLIVLKEDLADAQDSLVLAFQSIDVTKIITHEDQRAYQSTYDSVITGAEGKVSRCEDAISELKDELKEKLAGLKAKGDKLKFRLASIGELASTKK